MSKQQPESGQLMNRRTLIKTVGAVGTAGVLGKRAPQRYQPVGQARAAVPLVAIGLAAGGAAVGYLAKKAADKYLGDEGNYSGYTGSDALISDIWAGSLNMTSANERVMTTINNNVSTSKAVGLAKGKAAIVEAMNAGASNSEAQTAANDAVKEYYSVIQENVLTHAKSQLAQGKHYYDELVAHSDTGPRDAGKYVGRYSGTFGDLHGYQDDSHLTDSAHSDYQFGSMRESQIDWNNPTTPTVTLLDGTTTVDFPEYEFTDGSYNWVIEAPTLTPSSDKSNWGYIGMADPDSSEYTWYYHEHRYDETMTNIKTEYDDVNTTLSGFADDVYSQWEAGEIPTEDLVDPITAATELEQDYDGMQGQGAFAAMLGIPTSADQTVYIELLDSEVNIWADFYTEHVPTDAQGNETGFETDTTYSPSTWSEPLFIAYERTAYYDSDGNEVNESEWDSETGTSETVSDFTEIEQDFVIQQIETPNGETVESFQTKSRNVQTADVAALEEELAQVREAQLALQEEAQSGAGGFLSDLSTKEKGVGAAIGSGILYFIAK